jgi:hypothetical protein
MSDRGPLRALCKLRTTAPATYPLLPAVGRVWRGWLPADSANLVPLSSRAEGWLPMEPMSDMLQGELERLFELDAIVSISAQLLGFDPANVGSTATKSAFARALVAYCEREDALPALADAILLSSTKADPKLRELATPRACASLRS